MKKLKYPESPQEKIDEIVDVVNEIRAQMKDFEEREQARDERITQLDLEVSAITEVVFEDTPTSFDS